MLPAQDEFVKTLEKTYTEVERKKNKVSVGWYSESDMLTELKWKKKLEGIIVHHSLVRAFNQTYVYYMLEFQRAVQLATNSHAFLGRRLTGPSPFACRMSLTLSGWIPQISLRSLSFYWWSCRQANVSNLGLTTCPINFAQCCRAGLASTVAKLSTGLRYGNLVKRKMKRRTSDNVRKSLRTDMVVILLASNVYPTKNASVPVDLYVVLQGIWDI